MKAVLLAGGRGTRLSPLTDTTPKPLVRVLDHPVIEYTLSSLAALGITEALVTTHFHAQEMKKALGRIARGVKLHYLYEEAPLGTAGAVKAAEEFLDDDFLVLSGDALFDFDLSRAIGEHRESGALATLVLTHRDDVLEYGVVRLTEDGHIRAFSEKPSWQGVFSDLVNTGIYVCKKELLSMIPSGQAVDFSHDLFPRLLDREGALYGFVAEGYWCDIGSPEALYRCNMDALFARVDLPFAPRGRFVGEGEHKSFIGEGARLFSGARFDRCIIGAASEVYAAALSDSVLGHACRVFSGARVTASLLADAVECGENALLSPGSVLGEGAHVASGAHTADGQHIPAGALFEGGKQAFSHAAETFPGGLFSRTASPEELYPEFFRLGRRLGEKHPEGFLITRNSSRDAGLCASALLSGISLSAFTAVDAGVSTEHQTRFFARTLGLGAGYVFSEPGTGRVSVKLFDETGLIPTQERRRALSLALRTAGAETQSPACAVLCPEEVLKRAYRAYLLCRLPDLSRVHITLTPSPAAAVLLPALTQRGAEARLAPAPSWTKDSARTELFLDLDEGRLTADLYDGEGLIADSEHLRSLLILADKGQKQPLYALSPLPGFVEDALRLRGRAVVYPELELPQTASARARDFPARDAYLFDPAALVSAALGFWGRLSPEFCRAELVSALDALKPFSTRRGEYHFNKDKSARFFSRLWEHAEETESGLIMKTPDARAHLYPACGSVRIVAEGASAEAAEEFYTETVRALDTLEHTL